MKKNVLCAVLCLLFLSPAVSVFAADKTPAKVSADSIATDKRILSAVKLLKNTAANASYKRILGNNPTKKPIKIEFKNFASIDKSYAKFDGMGWMEKGKLYIYISDRHTDAPKEALAALISGLAVHVDNDDSINEEIFAWALEGSMWNKFINENPDLAYDSSLLVQRENNIESLYTASPSDVSYIRELIEKNNTYLRFKSASKGYSDEELNNKIQILYRLYIR